MFSRILTFSNASKLNYEFSDEERIKFIPFQAYFFFSSDEEDIKNRTIFQTKRVSNKYSDEERSHINAVKTEIENANKIQNLFLPQWSDEILLRFIYSCKMNIQLSKQAIRKHSQWFYKIFPFEIENNEKWILGLGAIYLKGRDSCFRPIVIIDGLKFVNVLEKYKEKEITNSIIYLFEFICDHLLIPGQIETWNVIIDLRELKNIYFFPLIIKRIIVMLSENYRHRLNKLIIYNFSNYFKRILLSLLDKSFNDYKIVHNSSYWYLNSYLEKIINKNQLEKKFGGNLDNVTTNFFPPQYDNDDNYLLSNRINLISPVQYLKFRDKGEIFLPEFNEVIDHINGLSKTDNLSEIVENKKICDGIDLLN